MSTHTNILSWTPIMNIIFFFLFFLLFFAPAVFSRSITDNDFFQVWHSKRLCIHLIVMRSLARLRSRTFECFRMFCAKQKKLTRLVLVFKMQQSSRVTKRIFFRFDWFKHIINNMQRAWWVVARIFKTSPAIKKNIRKINDFGGAGPVFKIRHEFTVFACMRVQFSLDITNSPLFQLCVFFYWVCRYRYFIYVLNFPIYIYIVQ